MDYSCDFVEAMGTTVVLLTIYGRSHVLEYGSATSRNNTCLFHCLFQLLGCGPRRFRATSDQSYQDGEPGFACFSDLIAMMSNVFRFSVGALFNVQRDTFVSAGQNLVSARFTLEELQCMCADQADSFMKGLGTCGYAVFLAVVFFRQCPIVVLEGRKVYAVFGASLLRAGVPPLFFGFVGENHFVPLWPRAKTSAQLRVPSPSISHPTVLFPALSDVASEKSSLGKLVMLNMESGMSGGRALQAAAEAIGSKAPIAATCLPAVSSSPSCSSSGDGSSSGCPSKTLAGKTATKRLPAIRKLVVPSNNDCLPKETALCTSSIAAPRATAPLSETAESIELDTEADRKAVEKMHRVAAHMAFEKGRKQARMENQTKATRKSAQKGGGVSRPPPTRPVPTNTVAGAAEQAAPCCLGLLPQSVKEAISTRLSERSCAALSSATRMWRIPPPSACTSPSSAPSPTCASSSVSPFDPSSLLQRLRPTPSPSARARLIARRATWARVSDLCFLDNKIAVSITARGEGFEREIDYVPLRLSLPARSTVADIWPIVSAHFLLAPHPTTCPCCVVHPRHDGRYLSHRGARLWHGHVPLAAYTNGHALHLDYRIDDYFIVGGMPPKEDAFKELAKKRRRQERYGLRARADAGPAPASSAAAAAAAAAGSAAASAAAAASDHER